MHDSTVVFGKTAQEGKARKAANAKAKWEDEKERKAETDARGGRRQPRQNSSSGIGGRKSRSRLVLYRRWNDR